MSRWTQRRVLNRAKTVTLMAVSSGCVKDLLITLSFCCGEEACGWRMLAPKLHVGCVCLLEWVCFFVALGALWL